MLQREQIIDSLKNFGLTASTKSVVVIRVQFTQENEGGRRNEIVREKSIFEAMQTIVQGQLSRIDNLGALPFDAEGKGGTDRKRIRKVSLTTLASEEHGRKGRPDSNSMNRYTN